jgi:hypothetical protein
MQYAMIVNFVLFQLAWFACVLGAAHGHPWVGPLVVAAVVAYHLARASRPGPELALLGTAACIGLVFDSALVATGWLAYPSGQWHVLLAPYWIVAMWVAFATTLNLSLNWLKGRPALSIAFGAFGGPMAYLAGAALGGVSLVEQVPALAMLALGWALITPLLVALSARLNGWRPAPGNGVLAAAAE